MNAAPEHRDISSALPDKPRAEPAQPVRTTSSRFAKPKVLMGEVTMPRGAEISAQREAFRAFMQSRRLTPSTWAKNAGVPMGEILGFLTGRTRLIAPATLQKLAGAAGCDVSEMFR